MGYQKIIKEEGAGNKMAKQLDIEIGKIVTRDIICECVLDNVLNKPLKTKQKIDKSSNEKEKAFEIISIESSSSSSTTGNELDGLQNQRTELCYEGSSNKAKNATYSHGVDTDLVLNRKSYKRVIDSVENTEMKNETPNSVLVTSNGMNVPNNCPILVGESGINNPKQEPLRKDNLNTIDEQNVCDGVLESPRDKRPPGKWKGNGPVAGIDFSLSCDTVPEDELSGQDRNKVVGLGSTIWKELAISHGDKKKIPEIENRFCANDQIGNSPKRKIPLDFFVRPFNGSKFTIQKFVIIRTTKKRKI